MALTRPRYSQIYDTDYKQSVRLATTADVGNLFAGGNNITNTVDSTTVIANDRILVKNQNDARQNGIYRVVTAGTGSNGTWIRALDADASDKVTSGMTTVVTAGPNYAGTTWKLTTPDPITLGTTELTFINPFQQATPGAAGSGTQVQYNTSGQLTGTPSFTFNETGNVLTVAGNVVSTSGFFVGNGSQLTGIDATQIQNGTSSVKTYSSSNVAINVGGSNVLVASSGNLHLSTGIMPTANVTYDLGSPSLRWRSGYFSGGSLHVGNLVINESAGGLSVSGNLQVTGNLTVDGDLAYLNVNNIRTNDSLLYLAHNNSTDFLDIGIVGIWSVDGNTEYGGLARDATDGIWKFFEDVSALPTTTVDFGGSARSSVNVNHLLAQGNVLCAANLTVGGRLNAGGSPGTSGQYLSSTGTGISWTSIDFSTLTNNDLNSFNIADNEWGNLQINSYQVAQFSPSYTNVTAELIRFDGNVNIPSGRLTFGSTGQVKIGDLSGISNQGGNSVAIGFSAGQVDQGTYTVAIGNRAGNSSQQFGAVAVGYDAGRTSQGSTAVAVGTDAGRDNQRDEAVAVGIGAGQYNQRDAAVAIGSLAGNNNQGISAVAIGELAATSNQGNAAIAIGLRAGYQNQEDETVAIGKFAGRFNQKTVAVAMGFAAGTQDQGSAAVAIGNNAGSYYQDFSSVAIGESAGNDNQGNISVAIGAGAGDTNQGNSAVALGAYAGSSNQHDNSIVLNATGSPLESPATSSFTVKPVRTNSNTGNVLSYNTSTGEVTYASNVFVDNQNPIYYNSNTISANVTIPSSTNAMSAGPITIATGVTVTVNGDWSIV